MKDRTDRQGEGVADVPIRFVNRFGRNAAALGGACFVALSAWAIVVEGREVPEAQAMAGVLLAFSAFFTVRAIRGFSVIADSEGVRVSTFLRQHRFRWRDVRSFERDTGVLGTFRRDWLVVIRPDQSVHDFGREINSKVGSATHPSPIEELVRTLEAERTIQCSGMEPS